MKLQLRCWLVLVILIGSSRAFGEDKKPEGSTVPSDSAQTSAEAKPQADASGWDERCRCQSPPSEMKDGSARVIIIVDANSGMTDKCADCNAQKMAIMQWGVFDLLDAICGATPTAVISVTDQVRTLHKLVPMLTLDRWRIRREVMALRPAPGPSGPTIPGDFHLLFEQAEPRAPQEAKNTVVLLIAGRPGSTITRLVKQAGERGFQLHVVGVSMGQADRPTLDELARQVGGPPPIFIQSSREYATAYATLLEDFGAACASDDQATQKLRKAISDCCRDKESLCCELRTKEIEVIKIREELLRSLKIVDQCDGNIKQIEKLVRELLSIVKIVKKGDMPPSNDPNVTEILDIIKVTLRKHAEQQIKRIEKMEAAIKVELSATNKQISSIQSVLTEIHKETTVIRQEVIEIHKVIENPHPVKVDVDVVAIADRVVSQARGWLNLFFTLLVILLALVLCCLLISRRVNVSVHRMSPRVEESAVFRPERPSCNDSC